jgi:N-acetylated-alpha-linked acidic dipeptidase
VFGAQDPLSGHTAMMEEAKSLGALAKSGWRPGRTLVYASWDGEEPGLLGSTEWAETHADELRSKALVYINTDDSERGIVGAQASYSLRRLFDQAASDVTDPETGISVRDRAAAVLQVRALADDGSPQGKASAKSVAQGADLPLGDLGSGSDFTPFAQHLGIASVNLGFGGEGQSGGVYHSAYDTFEHYIRFGDPGFVYGVVLAKTAGRLVLRAADADVAPLQFGNLAASVESQVVDLEKLVSNRRERAETVNRLLDQKAFALSADPQLTSGEPERESVPPEIDFAPLERAAQRLQASASAYDLAARSAATPEQASRVGPILQRVEQTLTDARGLPGRPWYRHLIYSPGLLTGYGAKTLPGVREAIEAGRWAEAVDYIGRTAAALNAASATLDEASRALRS